MVAATVPLDPAAAFLVFTRDVDLWWRRGPAYRARPESSLRFEPGPAGRLVETGDPATGEEFVIGRVLAWEPGVRLVLEWRGPNYRPGERTEVEVGFRAVPAGTRVTIEHRGWQTIPPDHPVRHGLDPVRFLQMLGAWWQAQLAGLAGRSIPGA